MKLKAIGSTNTYNLQRDSDGAIGWVDLQKEFSTGEVLGDNTHIVFVIFVSEELL